MKHRLTCEMIQHDTYENAVHSNCSFFTMTQLHSLALVYNSMPNIHTTYSSDYLLLFYCPCHVINFILRYKNSFGDRKYVLKFFTLKLLNDFFHEVSRLKEE